MELLERFLPQVENYATRRNFDFGPSDRSNVSRLAPYLTTRLITQRDVLTAILANREEESAGKFIQEVCWRTYWRGWLEMRPEVWTDWLADCEALGTTPEAESAERAITEPTGIDCFDAWVAELRATGYLHNHARMWFASIWIFTLGLPWQLGAQFFYRHLLDADAASNTLCWRWVAGIQTEGKHYLATADNISRFTEGRFSGSGRLVEDAGPISDSRKYVRQSLELPPEELPTEGRVGVLLHGEDCCFELAVSAVVQPVGLASGWPYGFNQMTGWDGSVTAFRKDALVDATERAVRRWNVPHTDLSASHWGAAVAGWAEAERLDCIITPFLPIGPWRDFLRPRLAEVACPVHEVVRDWDRALWPHADRGFFPFRRHLRDFHPVRDHFAA